MSALPNAGIVLLRRPIPVTIAEGGLTPILVLGTLFAWIGAQGGLPIATATVIGAIGGTASLIAHELGHVRAARKLTGLRPTGVSLIWLGALNVAIGVLSLVPASPLDGYKLIVGLLWSALGSEARARRFIKRVALT